MRRGRIPQYKSQYKPQYKSQYKPQFKPQYSRPQLTREKFNELIENYTLIDNIKDVELFTHIMYYNVDEYNNIIGYKYGGYLIQINEDYVKMSNKPVKYTDIKFNNISPNHKIWTTQIKNNIFYAKNNSTL